MVQAVRNGPWKLFFENNLRLCINARNFEQFTEDYQDYREKKYPETPSHSEWLLETSAKSCAASPKEHRLFLHMLERFRIPPEYFTPLPAGVIGPDLHYIHSWRDVSAVGTDFHCTDDGGLLSDSAPEGKTFRLVNELGFEAVVTIKEDRRTKERGGLDFDEQVCNTSRGMLVLKAEFLAKGYIEGYTTKLRPCTPDILIRLGTKGMIAWLAWYENNNDILARNTFPLWQKYYRVSREQSQEREDIPCALLEAYEKLMDGQ